MNKYKLVPYLVLSKEDAQIEKMQEELATILNNKSIDVATKLALYEDLLNKIKRFKESIPKDSVVRIQLPTPTTLTTSSTQTESGVNEQVMSEENDFDRGNITPSIASGVQSRDGDYDPPQDEDNDSSLFTLVTPPGRKGRRVRTAQRLEAKGRTESSESPSTSTQGLPVSKKKRNGRDVPTKPLTPSQTRRGTDYVNPNLSPNRPLGKTRQWQNPNNWKY